MFQSNISLKNLNTLQIPCTAKLFSEITSTYQVLQLLETPERNKEKHWILWWGSNTLFLSDFFDGIVLNINIKGIKILKESPEEVIIQVGAWENRDDFIHHCIEHQRWGLENLIAIPGKVGTSAVSNIGAYGQEVQNSIEEVVWVNLERKTIQKLSNEECNFSYRQSIFKNELQGNYLITHVIFRLKKIDENYSFETSYSDIQHYFEERNLVFEEQTTKEKIWLLSSAILEIRTGKLPDWKKIATAGSFFKNPECGLPEREQLKTRFPELKAHLTTNETMKLSAGQLIELCWWKGKSENKVKMSEKHALILINEGASGQEVADYAEKIQDSVLKRFWILLEPEVIYCS